MWTDAFDMEATPHSDGTPSLHAKRIRHSFIVFSRDSGEGNQWPLGNDGGEDAVVDRSAPNWRECAGHRGGGRAACRVRGEECLGSDRDTQKV